MATKIWVYALVRNHLRGGLINRCHACGAPKNVPCEAYMNGENAERLPV